VSSPHARGTRIGGYDDTLNSTSPDRRNKLLDCCDLHLATSTCTIALVTSMVLVTMSGRAGRVSSFLLVRHIGCVGHHQPDPVGVRFARHMPNKMRETRIRHRRQDRLRGVTPPSHGGNQQAGLNHLCIHTTTARGACCREAVLGELCLVDLQANPKSISHQPKHNSRVSYQLCGEPPPAYAAAGAGAADATVQVVSASPTLPRCVQPDRLAFPPTALLPFCRRVSSGDDVTLPAWRETTVMATAA
jgi:hypothetical protein